MASRETLQLVRGYATESTLLRDQLVRFIARTWLGLDDYGDSNVASWVQLVAPRLEATTQRMGAMTAAYLAAVERAELGESRVRALEARKLTSKSLRKVDAEQLMRRAGERTWRALDDGHMIDDAARIGLDRATSMAETNVQLARTHTSLHALSRNDRVVGYRRVLNSARPCALCAVASTQRYHKQELQPIHPGCNCGVLQIFGEHDPGQVIDANRLADVHEQVARRFGGSSRAARDVQVGDDVAQYRDLVVVNKHGEIGPVLGVRGQTFTGPDDLTHAA